FGRALFPVPLELCAHHLVGAANHEKHCHHIQCLLRNAALYLPKKEKGDALRHHPYLLPSSLTIYIVEQLLCSGLLLFTSAAQHICQYVTSVFLITHIDHCTCKPKARVVLIMLILHNRYAISVIGVFIELL